MKVSNITNVSHHGNSLLNKARFKLAPLFIAGSMLIPSALRAQEVEKDTFNGTVYPAVTTEPEENFNPKGHEALALVMLGTLALLCLAAFKNNKND